MASALKTMTETVWDLPPLILHPFNEKVPPASLLENSRAALMLSGLIPNDGSAPEELQQRILAGRYSEVRMLYYLGKDVFRWIEQCVESAAAIHELAGESICPQSFAELLTSNPPAAVREKLMGWGVLDHVSIFSRAIGLNAIFTSPPEFARLSEEFLQNYQQYTDSLFRCFMQAGSRRSISPTNFQFALYASGEYSKLLESTWWD